MSDPATHFPADRTAPGADLIKTRSFGARVSAKAEKPTYAAEADERMLQRNQTSRLACRTASGRSANDAKWPEGKGMAEVDQNLQDI